MISVEVDRSTHLWFMSFLKRVAISVRDSSSHAIWFLQCWKFCTLLTISTFSSFLISSVALYSSGTSIQFIDKQIFYVVIPLISIWIISIHDSIPPFVFFVFLNFVQWLPDAVWARFVIFGFFVVFTVLIRRGFFAIFCGLLHCEFCPSPFSISSNGLSTFYVPIYWEYVV